MLRSNGSLPPLCASSSRRSRDSTRFGLLANASRRSNSIAVTATSRPSRANNRRASRSSTCRPKRISRRSPAAGRPCRLHPPQHAPDPGQKLARVERLRDVVVGAELEPDHPVDDLAGRGQHDDRHIAAAAQLAREAETVLAGHAQVEDHQVDRASRQHLARGGDAPCALTAKPCLMRYSCSRSRTSASSSTTRMWASLATVSSFSVPGCTNVARFSSGGQSLYRKSSRMPPAQVCHVFSSSDHG